TFHFIKNGESFHTFAIAKMLIHDKCDLIHKAVGWMLREVGKRIGTYEEESFLREYCREMPRVMLRYAIERFPDDKRRSYLEGRVERSLCCVNI
ncbi:MAG TPA: DNA alkylation repair protein, partial [Candidatus Omnitrophota bacterium]|nr:DNA alkylation repair protein [Candidatus Omnitrophota bacterium]